MDVSADRWAEISAVLDEVLERAPDAPESILDDVCDDPELREEVRAFLTAETDAPDFLEDEAADYASDDLLDEMSDDLDAAEGVLPVGTRVGAYEIAGTIGRGGMSTVYRAERTDGQFEHTVALKVMRPVLDASSVERFRAERQILASLDHPNVARVFDGGTTDDGRPFLVMEMVDGRPITTYCDEETLTVEERLRLFTTVVAAVQHAHQNLIVHRDLKPTNILVTGDGTVKLLDFGIAKVLEASAHHDAVQAPATRTGLHLMTPEYAAPEQVRGEAVTTATDVYALGILLYELLTGHRPYRLEQRSVYDIVQAVCESDPTRPSTIVNTTREVHRGGAPQQITPESVSSARSISVAQLQRTLRGDLDAIILCALRKSPGDRYRTADRLSEDVSAYLDGQPVNARQGSRLYRVRKFLSRNWRSTAAAAVVLAVILASGITLTVQSQRLAEERDRARAEAQKSAQVSEFMKDLFSTSNPYETGTSSVTLETVLQRAAERTATELGDQPEVQAEMLMELGDVYTHLGRLDSASVFLRRAVEVKRRVHGSGSVEVATALDHLGSLLRDRGLLDSAETVQRRVLDIRQSVYGTQHVKTAETINNIASVLYDQDDVEEALSFYEESLRIHQSILGEEHSNIAALTNNLASVYYSQQRYERAEELYRQTLALDRKLLGETHPYVGTDLSSLGLVLSDLGRLAEAESLLVRSLEIRRSHFEGPHPDVAISLYNLGQVLHRQGNYEAARSRLSAALDMRRTVYGDVHPRIASNLNALGLSALAMEDHRASYAYFKEATVVADSVYEGVNTRRARIYENAGRALLRGGRTLEAHPYVETALDIYRRAPDALPQDLAGAQVHYAETLIAEGLDSEADRIVREAIPVLRREHGSDAPATAYAQAVLGRCLAARGETARALPLLRDAARALRTNDGPAWALRLVEADIDRLAG